MPAMLDDPDSPTIYRVSGAEPYPDPSAPSLPADIQVRQVTLRDRQTVATIVPFASREQVPASLLAYLSDQFNKEIAGGDTYPMMDPLPADRFAAYWFQNFGAIMLLGRLAGPQDVLEGEDWARACLGSFYIKPNYPGRSSHVCNAGFLVTDAARNRGVGRLMGEAYLDWAPRLGYTYSVFNLVYETNVASCKIWDALGFKRIGRVKGCGNLKSYPGRLIDAIIYGRDLAVAENGGASGTGDDLVSDERFDKIKFYLKTGKYPNGADRAEKSRLRSAATHYKLVPVTEGEAEDDEDDGGEKGGGGGAGLVGREKLMLKDKEVIADGGRQYAIARRVHVQLQHGGINKTTATIAEKFHWSRIKETVSDVIRNCADCKEQGKANAATSTAAAAQGQGQVGSGVGAAAAGDKRRAGNAAAASVSVGTGGASSNTPGSAMSTASVSPSAPSPSATIRVSSALPPGSASPTGRVLHLPSHHQVSLSHIAPNAAHASRQPPTPSAYANPNDITVFSTSPHGHGHAHHPLPHPHLPLPLPLPPSHHHNPMLQDHPTLQRRHVHPHHPHHIVHHHHPDVYQPIDPQIINQPSPHHHDTFDAYNHAHIHGHHSAETDFQDLLRAADDDDVVVDDDHHPHRGADEAAARRAAEAEDAERAAVERDLDMLIAQDGDEDVEVVDQEMGGVGDDEAVDVDVDVDGRQDRLHGRDGKAGTGLYDVAFGGPG